MKTDLVSVLARLRDDMAGSGPKNVVVVYYEDLEVLLNLSQALVNAIHPYFAQTPEASPVPKSAKIPPQSRRKLKSVGPE